MRKKLVSAILSGLIAQVSTGVLAQTETEEVKERVIEEVVVSVNRRKVSVMDTPQSIMAVPEAQLALPTFNDLKDVINLVPGATGYASKQPAAEGTQLRGSGIIQSSADDGQAPVGYYVDDVPFIDITTGTPPPLGTFDLQGIEVLRGPQGTAFGLDSVGGSVILRTNPVDLESFGYKAQVAMSDVSGVDGNGHSVGGVLNIPVVEGVFGVRVSYLSEEDPGYGRVDGRPDIKNPLESTRDTLRVKALWSVNDKLNFELTHSEWNTEYTFLPGTQILDSSGGEMILSPLETPVLLDQFPDGIPTNDFEISWTTLVAKWDLGFAELTSATGYVDAPIKETNSEYIFDLGYGSGPQKSGVTSNQPAESISQELRLVSTTDAPLQWVGGLFYLDAESDAQTLSETPDYAVYDRNRAPVTVESWAAFGEIEYDLNEQWSLTAGLRYYEEDRVLKSQQDLGQPGIDDPYGDYAAAYDYYGQGVETVEKNSFDHTSYRVGLTWQPADNGMVYLTNSLSNRAPIMLGTSDRLALEGAGISFGRSLDAAELVNTEIGTKWTLADGSLQVEAAYVLGVWKNIPLWSSLNTPPEPISVPIPGTDAEVSTFEVALKWAVTDNLSVSYAGSFTDTKVTKTPSSDLVTGYPSVIREGGELFNYSPKTHNVGINYNHALSGTDWELFTSANYVTRDKPDGINPFTAPDAYVPARDKYKNLSLSMGGRKGPWELSLSVSNATDDSGQYMPRTALGGDDAQLFGLIQQPRTVAFQVRYDGMQ